MSSIKSMPDESHDIPPADPPSSVTNLPSAVMAGFEFPDEVASEALPHEAADSLASILHRGDWLDPAQSHKELTGRVAKLPRTGDEVWGLRLVRELGRGAFARVFLAEQLALAGRPVAVKISYAKRDESQTLAQLQHTHIVPIYSAQVDAVSGLRILVMPYFGGTTLDRLLAKAGMHTDRNATGRSLVTALDDLSMAEINRSTAPFTAFSHGPELSQSTVGSRLSVSQGYGAWAASRLLGRSFLGEHAPHAIVQARRGGQAARLVLERSSYLQAVVWIAARLADGLSHAHERGILHRDIKPSNVLIASDGQPMLLDFNLARDLKSTDSGAVAYVGGTLPYMAPEHLDAFNTRNPTPATVVDERSDIYSMGVVLFEMLTNQNPFPVEQRNKKLPQLLEMMATERRVSPPSARAINPMVTYSLDAVVRRCLEPEPSRRYQHAWQLAEDLQCELDSLPLRHTQEPSWRERSRKWMRRHPRLSSGGSIAALSFTLIAVLTYLVIAVTGRLVRYDAERRWIKFQEGRLRAQLLVHTANEPGQSVSEGRRLCEQTLGLFDILGDPRWQRSLRVRRLDPEVQKRLADEAAELMILLARVRAEQVKHVKPAREQTSLIRDAVRLLDLAEGWAAPNVPRALYEDRSNYHRMLGNTVGAATDWNVAQNTPITTARDYYLRGAALVAEKQYADAIPDLAAALHVDPKHFWARFQLGICYYHTGAYSRAADTFSVCEAIWIECAWANFNRGLAWSALGQWETAIADYGNAIRKDPLFANAYLQRGLAYLNQFKSDEAIADFDRALELGCETAKVWPARAAAYAARGDMLPARDDYAAALRANPSDVSVLLSRGFAFAQEDPAQALADFDAALKLDDQSAQAHYGRAHVLAQASDRLGDAILAARAAVRLDPTLIAAHCTLAVLLGRAEIVDESVDEIRECLRQKQDGMVHYSAACVYALAARTNPKFGDFALQHLKLALEQNYGREMVRHDTDLQFLTGDERFVELLSSLDTTVAP